MEKPLAYKYIRSKKYIYIYHHIHSSYCGKCLYWGLTSCKIKKKKKAPQTSQITVRMIISSNIKIGLKSRKAEKSKEQMSGREETYSLNFGY